MTNTQAVDLSKAKWVLVAAMATAMIVSNGGQAQTQTQTQTEAPKTAEEVVSCEKDAEVVVDLSILEQRRTERRDRLPRKFTQLVQQWRNERGSLSSTNEMSMLPSYQNIMAMGPDALPLILAELRAEGDNPDQWFWALLSISEANDMTPPQIALEDQGNFRKMAHAWIEWGKDQGYAG